MVDSCESVTSIRGYGTVAVTRRTTKLHTRGSFVFTPRTGDPSRKKSRCSSVHVCKCWCVGWWWVPWVEVEWGHREKVDTKESLTSVQIPCNCNGMHTSCILYTAKVIVTWISDSFLDTLSHFHQDSKDLYFHKNMPVCLIALLSE